MTEVAFHFNVPEKLGYSCRLLRKASSQGAKVTVQADGDMLHQLDQALWTFAPHEFVTHCLSSAEPVMRAASSVILNDGQGEVLHHDVLLNLGQEVPPDFGRYQRLIELVTLDDEDRRLARQRWKYYTERGYVITRHDLQQSSPAQ